MHGLSSLLNQKKNNNTFIFQPGCFLKDKNNPLGNNRWCVCMCDRDACGKLLHSHVFSFRILMHLIPSLFVDHLITSTSVWLGNPPAHQDRHIISFESHVCNKTLQNHDRCFIYSSFLCHQNYFADIRFRRCMRKIINTTGFSTAAIDYWGQSETSGLALMAEYACEALYHKWNINMT